MVPPRLLLVLALGCVLAYDYGVSAANPGARVRLTDKGMNYVLKKVVEKLPGETVGKTFEEIHGRERRWHSKYEYWVKNLKITAFSLPSATVSITPGAGIKLSIRGARIEVRGDWRVKARLLIISWRNTGTLHAIASGIDIDVSFKLGKDVNGRPTILSTACTARVGGIKVNLRGSGMLNKVYELIVKILIDMQKKEIPPLVCESVKKVLSQDAARMLAGLKVVSDVGPNKEMILDYRLTQAPSFHTKYFDVMIKGEFAWKQSPAVPPFQAKPFPASVDYSKMFYVWLSDYVFNTYVHAFYVRQRVKSTLTRNMLPAGQGDFMNTTCPGLKSGCIGTRLKAVGTKHPGTSCSIGLMATTRPTVDIRPTGIVFHVTGDMPVHVLGNIHLFTLQGTVDMDIFTWIDGTTIKGRINSLKPSIKIKDSAIGDIPVDFINWLFEEVSQKYIVKELNKIAGQGLMIPNMKELKLVGPVLRLHSGSLMVSSDLVWSV